MYLGGNHVRVVCERMWRIAQDCAKKQGLASGSHGCKPPKWCTRAKHARSWSVAPIVALQNKSPKLARQFTYGLNSRVNPIARSSRQNTLFGKNWLVTFLLTLYIPLYPWFRESFQREFWERNPRENKIDSSTIFTWETLQIPLLSSSPLSNP